MRLLTVFKSALLSPDEPRFEVDASPERRKREMLNHKRRSCFDAANDLF